MRIFEQATFFGAFIPKLPLGKTSLATSSDSELKGLEYQDLL
jgi:hypothetical protein